MGFRPAPAQVAGLIEKVDEKTVASAVYSIDRFGRRITPGQGAGRRDRPLLFFGCSFAFGFGVNDDQTLPYYVAQALPGYRVYNYGFTGYGPQNMLARLSETDIRSEIAEKGKPAAVYVFIDDQVRRAIGSMSWVGAWGEASHEDLPYYAAGGPSGTLTRHGSFKTGRPFVTRLYQLAAKSAVLRRFAVDFPPSVTDAHLELVARMIEESRDAFRTKFGSDEFFVLFFPGLPGSPGYDSRLIPMLRAMGIRSLDYDARNFYREVGPGAYLANWHPSPSTYKALAVKISGDLAPSP
jgi:hypothetical protein